MNIGTLARSAMLVCIRRGEVFSALRFARIALAVDKGKFERLLWKTIASDCGLNLKVLGEILEYEKTKNQSLLLRLVRRMAEGNHTRVISSASWLINHGNPTVIWNTLRKTRQSSFLAVLNQYPKIGNRVYAGMQFIEGKAWVFQVALKANIWDDSNEWASLPYFYTTAGNTSFQRKSDECGAPTWYDRWFPLEALGQSNEIGRQSLHTFAKKLDVSRRENIANYVLLNEGRLQRNVITPASFDWDAFALDQSGMTEMISREVSEHWLPQIMDIRRWMLRKPWCEMFNQLKRRYEAVA